MNREWHENLGLGYALCRVRSMRSKGQGSRDMLDDSMNRYRLLSASTERNEDGRGTDECVRCVYRS